MGGMGGEMYSPQPQQGLSIPTLSSTGVNTGGWDMNTMVGRANAALGGQIGNANPMPAPGMVSREPYMGLGMHPAYNPHTMGGIPVGFGGEATPPMQDVPQFLPPPPPPAPEPQPLQNPYGVTPPQNSGDLFGYIGGRPIYANEGK